jgi:hypothetical protein
MSIQGCGANLLKCVVRMIGIRLRAKAFCSLLVNADAASIFSEKARPRLHAEIVRNNEKDRFEFKLVPYTLRGALMLQAGEAITRNIKFLRCECPGCGNWFRLGRGGHTTRRMFCGDRCRVAAGRLKKKQAMAVQ